MSSTSIRIRPMRETDLAIGDQLRALAGWNQTLQDWRRWWSYQPEGCFIGEWQGQPVATATTTSYGQEVAWIGMVLVHPEFRRRGIAAALLQHCLEYLSSIRAVKLDATPLGKPLYQQLGFVDEWPLTRWERRAIEHVGGREMLSQVERVTPYQAKDRDAVHAIDRRAFGVNRARLLDLLIEQSKGILVRRGSDGVTTGFAMLREGSRADYVGPVAAVSEAGIEQLVAQTMAEAGGRPLYWDIPDGNLVAVQIAKNHGFQPQRPLVRMCRGVNEWPENRNYYFGITDPAVG